MTRPATTLRRSLGLTTAVLLVISSMIGSGIFKKAAPMSAALMDDRLVLLAWLVAGMFTMFGVFSYAGLATLTSEAGGQMEYFRLVYGRFWAFLYGWASFAVIQTASIASIAYVFAESVNSVLPLPDWLAACDSIRLFGLTPFANSGVKLLAVATILILTLINYFGVEEGGWLNNVLTLAKVTGIIMLIWMGFHYGQGTADQAPGVETARHLSRNWNDLMGPFFLALLSAFWAFDGWINVTFITGEIRSPQRNIPIAIIAGTAVVMLLYYLVNMAFFRVMGPEEMAAIHTAGDRVVGVEVALRAMGPGGLWAIAVLIMLCTLGATNASLMSTARIYYRMANTGLFFKAAGQAHPRFQTPHKALLMQMVWSVILVFSGTFDQLTDMLIFASFIFYGSGALGLLIMKRRRVIVSRVIGYPVLPVVFVLFCILLVGNTLISMPHESLTGLGLIDLGVPLYAYFNKE